MNTLPYVLLEGVVIDVNFGTRFFTMNEAGKDPTKSNEGETWYKVLGYAESVEDAQIKLYGRTFPLDNKPVQYGQRLNF